MTKTNPNKIPEWTVAVFGMEVGPDKYRAFNVYTGAYGPWRVSYQQAANDIETEKLT